jgi:hypothetical protein
MQVFTELKKSHSLSWSSPVVNFVGYSKNVESAGNIVFMNVSKVQLSLHQFL